MHVGENPFASRFVKPGAMRYLSPDGDGAADMDRLIGRLASFAWRGAVIGPHGSGKSTLLADLSAELGRRGYDVRHIGPDPLHGGAGQRPTPHLATPKAVFFVDGFDGLPLWQRWLLVTRASLRTCGLVVTGHAQGAQIPHPSDRAGSSVPSESARRVANASYMGLPILACTWTSAELAGRIAGVLAGEAIASAAHAQISASFARHDGNLREVLFDLYDLYERQTLRERTEWRAPAVQLS